MKKMVLLSGICSLAACGGGGGGGTMPVRITSLAPSVSNDDNTMVQTIDDVVFSSTVENIKFNTENGKVVSLDILDDSDNLLVSLMRDGNTNNFSGYDNISGSKVGLELHSLGSEAGLSYADFGYFKESVINNGIAETGCDVYAGGYSIKEVNKPINEITFNGSAVANVTYVVNSDAVGEIVSHTKDANLKVASNGTETLTMNFSKADRRWYDVVVTGVAGVNHGGTGTLAINNTNSVEVWIPDNFRMTDSMKNDANEQFMAEHTYYGDNNQASEVVSQTFYAVDKNENEGLIFSSSFGGKAQ